jgi:hypothetical protein
VSAGLGLVVLVAGRFCADALGLTRDGASLAIGVLQCILQKNYLVMRSVPCAHPQRDKIEVAACQSLACVRSPPRQRRGQQSVHRGES